MPGTAMRGWVDTTPPPAFGIKNRLYSLKIDGNGLEPSESLQTVGYYDKNPQTILASGYASQENREKLAGKAFATVEEQGTGNVVFLLDNTQYRLFCGGPARMVLNAVLWMHGM